ncbi:outer membrane beta-barrel protein [Flavobacterium capsici]|uniref:Outer membrane beta-barrel protein n=1 Tax=Flavobacterium capsici TaxID=3075618 RepID=A0AA96J9G2_9FLAO|nr:MULTISPECIES: outer membrane beta-barrel protein [unclassified Flavobacterium]WNM19115.1 outer membrane beta-barrel protein [Flavobacterium sp. PMR2A8]WNM20504.1 outer membrane beta-barrel protein [Flavobacterium sp. PMTSA4]
MPKSFLLMLSLFCCSIVFSQNSISLKGKVIDKNSKIPLESVTVYLTSKIDSTVVDYTITNKMGFFDLKLKKTNKPLVLKISYVSYNDFKEDVSNLNSDKDFGTIELEEAIKNLDEVVVKSETPPIRIKKDTLEFNASSFKVGADANVEALLKQLPGVDISPEGKITVNGKEVNNILVNGKPFFGKDGKIATQNLPADIIDKVQVVDTKTKSEEISGEGASSEDKTINLTIQEDKNKGFFGKIMAGRGSDRRYESSLLLNYFKGERKISVLASSNNINSVGFSMNEIFDNMGGGRNTSMYYNDDGRFGINGMTFGGGNGITKSNLVGVNYQDQWFKKLDNTTSYYFSNAENENINRTQSTNLLPTGTTLTNSNSISSSISNGHNLNTDFEIKLDSTATIYVSPKFTKNLSKSRFSRDRITTDENLNELNRSNSDDYREIENSNFETEVSYSKRFKKKSRGMTVNLNFESKDQRTFNNTNSATLFADTTPDDIRQQNSFEREKQNDLRFEVRFGEPLTDSLRLSLTSEIKFNNRRESLNTFDFDAIANDYSDFNDLQSNSIRSDQFTYFPSTGLIIGKNKTNGRINFGPEFVNFKAKSDYLGVSTDLNKNYIFPKVKGYISHRIGKSKSIYANYNYEVSVPSASQLLPVENLSNPLNTIVGNENLDPTKRHSMYFGFNNYDYASRSGYYIYSGFNASKDAVVSSTVFDSNFKSITTYENVDRSFSSYFGGNWNKSFKKEKRTLRLSTGISFDYNVNQGLTNAVLFESRQLQINPRVNLTWSIDELITIAPSYRYSFSKTKYDNYVIDKADNFTHNAKIEITSYFPKKLVIGNDFGYTYNSNIAGGFRKDFYLWNTSIGYNFFNDQLLAKVKVYDLLNQNLNTRRTITPTAIIDSENTVLRRYVMFSLTYKIEKFGGKKKNDNMMFFED